MTHGLQITIRPFGPRWIAECGSDRVEMYDRDKALETWKKKYGEKYGVDLDAQEYTVVLPFSTQD